jgi:hypothetical protein
MAFCAIGIGQLVLRLPVRTAPETEAAQTRIQDQD